MNSFWTSLTALLGMAMSTVMAQQTQVKFSELNLAYAYATDFHVAANIIIFVTLVIFLSVFGISIAMWNMDPGRDSIIYRMTSQRMKKDQ